MKVALARAPLRLGASTCPLAFACPCTGPCPLAAAPRRLVLPRMANPAALGGFLDTLTGAIASAYETVTNIPENIADVISPPATEGDYTNVTFLGAKYPTSSVFTAEFIAVRTLNSLQGLVNDVATGLALPRDDGSITTRDNRSTLAPAGSAYVNFFSSKGIQILSKATAPVVAEPTTPTVLQSVLSGITFGILGGQDSSSPVTNIGLPSPATAGVAETTGPAWVNREFLDVSTQPRLDRIIADLQNGSAVVLTDGSVGVPQLDGKYIIIAPPGSINVGLYSLQTGRATVAPKAAAAAARAPVATTLDGLVKQVGSILTTGAMTATQLYAQQQVQKLLPSITTPAQQQAQTQVAALSAQLVQAQAALAAQKTAVAQAQATAQIQQLQAALQAAQAAAAVPTSGAVISPPVIMSGLSTALQPAALYTAPIMTSVQPTPATDFAGLITALVAQPAAAAPAVPVEAAPAAGGINWILVALGVAVVGGGVFLFMRRRRGSTRPGRAYHVRRRRRAYA